MNKINIKHICFDLDGTLVDSKTTILKATQKSLNNLNIKTSIPENEFFAMIGMHFIDIFGELNIDVPDFTKFISIYKDIYFDFIDESVLYPNVEFLLNKLNEEQITISLLTTKSQDQADRIVDHFKLRNNFSYVMGRRNGIEYKPSPAPLLMICNVLEIKPEATLMVGDTELDIECGNTAGSQTCAVSYGYRTRHELLDFKPNYIISNIADLQKIISN